MVMKALVWADGLKELDPGPSTHDGMHVDRIMKHGPHSYELLPPPTTCHL
jgi:hypothetical protein